MKAKNIMTTEVFTVSPDATVHAVATVMSEKGISAVPVVDHGKVAGIISEGDLLHRQELGTERKRTRLSWLNLIGNKSAFADFERKEHGKQARDIMTRDVLSVSEDASLGEIADTLESNNVKRVLVMHGTQMVGVVSRANIVRALAARPEGAMAPTADDDDEIRYAAIEALESMKGTSPWLTTVIVNEGIVSLYGTVEDEAAHAPSRDKIRQLPHVVDVKDHRSVLQPY